MDILQDSNKSVDYPEYFPEETSPPKGKSIERISAIKSNATNWLKTVADAWNKSFYW